MKSLRGVAEWAKPNPDFYEESTGQRQLVEFCNKVNGIYVSSGSNGGYCAVDTKDGLAVVEARVSYYNEPRQYPHLYFRVIFRKDKGTLTGFFQADARLVNRLPQLRTANGKVCIGVDGLSPEEREYSAGLYICVTPSADRRSRDAELRIWDRDEYKRKPYRDETGEIKYKPAKSLKIKF